ncbi:MAG: hypothetical protein MK137_06605 [Rickettsiales bacterium]|nr:hypothetical protein [Rickettsiales bacterium]
MVDLASEIQEDIKKERLEYIWQKYRYTLIILVLLFLVLSAVFIWWKGEQSKTSQLHGDEYYKLMKIADYNEQAALETKESSGDTEQPASKKSGLVDPIIADLSGDKRAFFLLKKASFLVSESETDQAVSLYSDIYQDQSVSQNLREFALITGASLAQTPEDIESKISSIDALLANNSQTNWRIVALRVKAILLLRSEKMLEAQEVYETISQDPASTAAMKEISSNMASYLGGGIPASVIRKFKDDTGSSNPSDQLPIADPVVKEAAEQEPVKEKTE